MNWGDVPAWVAIVISVVALVVSVHAQRETLKIQRGEAQAAAEARRPRVLLRISKGDMGVYRLRNDGDAPAVGLTLTAESMSYLTSGTTVPSLRSGECFDLYFIGLSNMPTHLDFMWEGQAEPVAVEVPTDWDR